MNIRLQVGGMSLAAIVGLGMFMSPVSSSGAEKGPYEATWESVNTFNPGGVAPLWLRDGKFGIYYHWGAFSVPAFREKGFGEWYGKWMNDPTTGQNKYHTEKYGDPAEWPYHFFIDGAKDKAGNWVKFEPKLKSDGGQWDPDEWAQLFYDAGAKFAGPIAEHHDGYSMWDSKVNEWNVGSKIGLDIAGEMIKAIRKKDKDMKVVATFHHAYPTVWDWWNPQDVDPVSEYGPEQSVLNGDVSLQKLYGKLPKAQRYRLWLDKLAEFIEAYQPDFVYHDVGLRDFTDEANLEHLAHYYNEAAKWDKDVLVTFKNEELNIDCAILDFEGGASDDIPIYSWVCDQNIGPGSWSYVEGMPYSDPKVILHSLITIISKNGALLLNLSPMADGTIPQEQKDSALSIGRWLKSFGECIYNTRPWATYGEGPNHTAHGLKGCDARDIRFTRNKENTVLYAVVCGWPGDGADLNITSFKKGNLDVGALTKVELLGMNSSAATSLKWKQGDEHLQVTMPTKKPFAVDAYPIRLTFSSPIPVSPVLTLQPLVSTEKGGKGVIMSNDTPTSKKKNKGVAARLAPGSYTTAQLKKLGFEDNTIRSIKVNAGWTVILYADDNFTGESLTCNRFIYDFHDRRFRYFENRTSSLKVIKADTAVVFP